MFDNPPSKNKLGSDKADPSDIEEPSIPLRNESKSQGWPFKPVQKGIDSGADPGQGARLARLKAALPSLPDGLSTQPPHSHKKYFIIGLVGLVLIAAGLVAYSSTLKNSSRAVEKNLPSQIDKFEGGEAAGASPEIEEGQTGVVPGADLNKDTDFDGLTDIFELDIGTSIFSVDTDGDGLLDDEEIRVYDSDPLRADTDGDGFLDGVEVRSGYSPVGPGKL